MREVHMDLLTDHAFTIFKWTTNGTYQETLVSNSYQKQDQDDPFIPADGLIFQLVLLLLTIPYIFRIHANTRSGR
jgi:hypothetical protein